MKPSLNRVSAVCCSRSKSSHAPRNPVNAATGSTHLAAANSLAPLQLLADVRTAVDQRDHHQLAVLLQQCSGQELASAHSPLPLYHAAAGSGWAEGIVMLARAGLPVSEADEEVIVLYSLLPRAPPFCKINGSGSHTALSLAAALGNVQAAGALLAAGADANASGPAGHPSICITV